MNQRLLGKIAVVAVTMCSLNSMALKLTVDDALVCKTHPQSKTQAEIVVYEDMTMLKMFVDYPLQGYNSVATKAKSSIAGPVGGAKTFASEIGDLVVNFTTSPGGDLGRKGKFTTRSGAVADVFCKYEDKKLIETKDSDIVQDDSIDKVEDTEVIDEEQSDISAVELKAVDLVGFDEKGQLLTIKNNVAKELYDSLKQKGKPVVSAAIYSIIQKTAKNMLCYRKTSKVKKMIAPEYFCQIIVVQGVAVEAK